MKYLAALCLLTVSCSTQPVAHHWPEIQIASEPPGARIEIDGDYVGTTPLTVEYKRGSFAPGIPLEFVIRATPSDAGLYTQSKYYGAHDPTPRNVFFDMRLSPVAVDHNFNYNINKHTTKD